MILAGRLGGALVEAAGLAELRTPIVLGFMTCGITAGASLGVMGAAALLGETGNAPAIGATIGFNQR